MEKRTLEKLWDEVVDEVMALSLPDKKEADLMAKIMIYVDKLKKHGEICK